MKDFFAGTLGTVLGCFSQIIHILSFIPLSVMGLPSWAFWVIVPIEFIPIIGSIIEVITWIIGLFFVISGPQNWQAIVYYIAFVMVLCVSLFHIILVLYSKNYE